MVSCVRSALTNYRGGLIGVLIYLVITALVFFCAFMAAFGQPTQTALLVLQIAALWFTIANPIWAIPLSYLAGGYLLCRKATGPVQGS
jgi:hypothetical protein